MRKKRFSAIVVCAIICILSTVGSASTNDDVDVNAWLRDVRSRFAGTTITIAAATHPATTAMKEVVKEFENATNVKIVWDEMEEGLVDDKVLLEHQAKTSRYDIIMNCVEYSPFFVRAGALEDLRPYLDGESSMGEPPAWFDFEDIMLGARDMFYDGDAVYGVPFAGTLMFFLYNKDVFAQYDKSVPQTWEEVVELANFFKQKGLNGIAFRAQRGWQFTMIWSVFMFPFGGGMINPATQTPVIDNQGNMDSLKYMISLKDFAPMGIDNMNYPEVWDALMSGRTAMAIETSSAPSLLEDRTQSPVAGKIGYARLPEGPKGGYSGVWGWGYSISSQSQHKDAAWAAIVWLTSKLNQSKYLEAGGIVTRRSALTNPELQQRYPHYQALYEAYEQAGALASTGWEIVPKIPEFAEMTEILGLYGSKAFTGEMSVEEACTAAQLECLKVVPLK